MPWSQVNKTTWDSAASATSHTPGAFPAATAGNLLVLLINTESNLTALPTGFTYAEAGVNYTVMYIFYKVATGGETSMGTLPIATNRSLQTCLMEYSGGTATPFYTADSMNNATNTPTTPSLITVTADTLLIAAFGKAGSTTWSALQANWTQQSNQFTTGATQGDNDYMFVASRIPAATGTYDCSLTQSGANNNWASAIAAFTMQTGGGGGPASKNHPLLGNPFQRLHRGARA